MTNLNTLFSRALLALALLAGAGAATASPIYHVALDTHGASGDGGLQIDFLPFGTNDVLTATISGLAGAFTGMPDLVNVTQSGGSYTLKSDAFSEFFQTITLGGQFGFDVTFAGMPTDGGSTGLTVSLIGATGDYLSFGAAQISLQQGSAPVVSVDPGVAAVTPANPVPEPSDLLLMASGLVLLTWTQRRRMR
jgi:hypothetical protein